MGGNSSKMAEEIAQLCKEMREDRKAQLRRERMAEKRAQLCMTRMAEEMAQLRREIRPLVDLQTSHARMAEEMAQLRREIRPLVDLQTSHARRATGRPESPDSDVSLKSDRSNDSPIDFKDRVSPRWGDSGSDVSAVEDFNKLLDILRTEEMAQRDMERMAKKMAQREKERIVVREALLYVTRRATGRPESPDSGVSLKSDRSNDSPIDFKDRVSPRWGDSGSDVSAVEDFNKLLDILSVAEETAQREKERMAMGNIKSFDSVVSLESDQSKAEPFDFKDRVSVIGMDFSSSEEEDESDDQDLVESPDDLEEMNQELSSEVGWKHLEAPVSSCS